jgi:drug/metabolite transporter (DMT)-like permease
MREQIGAAIALAVAAQFCFASKAIFIKLAYRAQPGLDAVTLLAWRMLASLPLFLLLAWWGRRQAEGSVRESLSRKDIWLTLWLGFVGYYLASFLDFLGLQYISAALERLIVFSTPTIVVALSWLFFRKPITQRVVLALVVSYTGIVCAFWHDLRVTQHVAALATGSALVLASAVAYALYLIGGADITKRIGSTKFAAYMTCVSTGFVLAQFFVLRPMSALQLAPQVWGHVAGLAIISTVLPVWMTAEALKRLGASRAAIYGSVGPIFTIGLGVAFLGESVSALQLFGAALTIVGVSLMGKK